MALNDVLKNADRLRIVAEANLENTLIHPWSFEDWNAGGCLANAGNFSDVTLKSNSFVRLANGSVPGAVVNKALSGTTSITRKLDDPFEGAAASVSVGTMSIMLNESSDDLHARTFEDENVLIKVGGLVNKNKTDEQILDYSQYENWLAARFTGYDRNERTVDVAVGMKSDELTAKFPPNIYEDGDSKGLAKPVMYGVKEGYAPRKIGGGIYQFHDGVCDMVEPVINKLDLVCVTEDFSFTGSPITTSGVGGGTAITSADYSWSSEDERTLTSAQNTITVSEGFSISADTAQGRSMRIAPDLTEAPYKRYLQHHFVWDQIDAKNLRVETDPKLNVVTDGDVDIVITNRHPSVPSPYRASWFKINAVGTGTVTFNFDDFVKDVTIVIRAVREPIQSISNFSKTPDSVEPAFGGPEVFNRKVKFSDVNSKTISFDYSATTDAALCAIWIEEITVYETQLCTVNIDLNPRINDLDIDFSFDNDSQKIEYEDDVINSAAPSYTFTGMQANLQFNVEIGYGGVIFSLVGGDREGDARGARSDGAGGYILNPEPAAGGYQPSFIINRAKPFLNDLPPPPTFSRETQEFELSFDIEILSGILDQVNVGVVFGSDSELPLKIIKVSGDTKTAVFRDIITNAPSLPLPNGFRIFTWRGDIGEFGWTSSGVSNPDTEFEVKISNLKLLPTTRRGFILNDETRVGNQTDITVYVNEQNTRITLPTFRVASARAFKNRLPKDVCVYDNRGYIAVSSEYSKVFGDFVGQNRLETSINALRDISKRAAARDYITSSVAGKRVGFVIDTQLPYIRHIEQKCLVMDYFYREKETEDGIEIFERYDFESHPADFVIEEKDIIFDSYRREGSAPRPYQYVVEYRADDSEPEFTRRVESEIGFIGKSDPTTIKSVFFNLADNEALARRIARDSIRNDISSIELRGIGWGIREGDAGIIMDSNVSALRPCVIMEVSETDKAVGEDRRTKLTFKVLKGKGSYNG